MPLRAVTLDAGGTLIAPAEPVGVTYARVAAAHGIVAEATLLERGFRDAFAGAPPLAFPGLAGTACRAAERAWWRAVVAHAFGAAAAEPGFEPAFAALFAHYAHGDAWRVLPGAVATLAALRARGLRLAVVSNFDARLHRVLADLGLAAAVERVLASTEVGSAKPSAGIFTAACAALGVEAGDVLHVGDAPCEDAAGARAAGLRAVLVGPGPPAGGGVARIARLDALPGLVDAQA
ncbi:MAG: HAD-IA family hydrolase [bacterium]|nr:HAD-IA family hydrolase [bacterium]